MGVPLYDTAATSTLTFPPGVREYDVYGEVKRMLSGVEV
jgi:hypothetical protein